MDPLVGTLVDGRYKLLAALASGSMGTVYRAERIPVGKLVAVKFLHATFQADAEFLARFERETRLMSKLAHPNCVSVVDFGMFDNAPYLVMEYVDGVTLRSMLDDEVIAVPRAVGLARQLAAGLAYAHAQDIIHRDIKPANIMVSEAIGAGEVVHILDFGLARLRGPASGRGDPTAANVVVGTPNYMAPEQTIAGTTLDARTDIYAAGVVLFEMVTGERPFQADDTPSVLALHRHAPIPRLVDRVGPDVVLPDGLQTIIDTALAKDPADRYPSAIELAAALEALGATLATGAQRVLREDETSEDTAVAPTLLAPVDPSRAVAKRRLAKLGLALVGLVLVGGAAAAYLAHSRKVTVPPIADARVLMVADAAVVEVVDAAPVLVQAPDGQVDASGSGGEADGPSASETDQIEIEMDPDPVNADDPIPGAGSDDPNVDNDTDAPETAPVEPATPSPAPLAKSVHDAVLLIQAGDKDLALRSLRALWGSQENSAYIPFLIGNLYFDKRWWNVAMDHYKLAITKNGGYKQNQVLTRNIIRMLGSRSTATRAETFLKKIIGRPALGALQKAAKSDANPTVKKAAARIARALR